MSTVHHNIDIEAGLPMWYTSRNMVDKEKKAEKITAKITPSLKAAILEIVASDERNTESNVVSALLGRGVAAFKRDGELFEPEANKRDVMLVHAVARADAATKARKQK